MRIVALAAMASVVALVGIGASAAAEFGTVKAEPCPKPAAPSCMLEDRSSRSQAETEQCNQDVVKLEKDLGTYRTCVLQESYRITSQINGLLKHYWCGTGQDRACAQVTH